MRVHAFTSAWIQCKAHANSIFAKLGLSEEKDLNRRVKAVLLYLSEAEPS